MKKLELTGKTFGKLTVLAQAGISDSGGTLWLSRCECGNEKVANGSSLKNGSVKSCGCLAVEAIRACRRTKKGQGGEGCAYSTYRYTAKKRGISFDISREDFARIVVKDCVYCGAPPSRAFVNSKTAEGKEFSKFVCNGLDREDSSVGYTLSNVLPCCKTCNFAKNDLTVDEFRAWVKRIHRHLNGDEK